MKATIKNSSPANKPDGRKANGGAREGAGRKPQNKINMNFTINKDVADKAREKFKGQLSVKVENFLKRISK